ncbi:MAG: ZIP family metal transporter [Candidatus Komeilibacteria bacterium]|jgi:zinc and cadmium transporter|nr:ZIP family metal transporter [Candidatus Komeilibacteria bacterium]
MLLIYIIIATLAVSLLSLIGLALFFKKRYSQKIMEATISLAAAVLLGNVFFHMLPEIVHESHHLGLDFHTISIWMLGSIIFLFFTEKYLHWHNCHHHQDHSNDNHEHHEKCVHPMGVNILIGDGLHNLIDGMAIAASFMLDVQLGILATIAIALHEIPQEVGDFSLLLYAGYTKTKALLWNLASALTAVLGGVITYFYAQSGDTQLILTSIAAGSFLYIAMSDIMPHLHNNKNKHYKIQVLWFVIGIILIYSVNEFMSFGHTHG